MCFLFNAQRIVFFNFCNLFLVTLIHGTSPGPELLISIPNEALDIFYKIYNEAYEQSFPLVRQSRARAKDKRWITDGLKTSIHHKNKLFGKFKLSPDQYRCEYTRYKNILTKCIRRTEEEYYKNLINSEKQNLHTPWNIFGSIINPKKIKK